MLSIPQQVCKMLPLKNSQLPLQCHHKENIPRLAKVRPTSPTARKEMYKTLVHGKTTLMNVKRHKCETRLSDNKCTKQNVQQHSAIENATYRENTLRRAKARAHGTR
mmetsp:Transcript_21481/g.31949  ORF Transcript_21481/g.31949 Transcript_21481/m.31949 type:complete len:107 (+) Transcript_21481:1555-1875(+)